MSRRAGGGYRSTFGFRKRIALQGGVAATVTPIALHCETKLKHSRGKVFVGTLCGAFYTETCTFMNAFVNIFVYTVVSIFGEVLNGVGVDGVGGMEDFFLFFFAFSFLLVFLRSSSFFFRFSSLFWYSPRGQGKRLQFTAKMGNFTPTPSAPTPCRTSRIFVSAFAGCRNYSRGSERKMSL